MKFNNYIREATYTGDTKRDYRAYGYKKSRSENTELETISRFILNNCNEIYKEYSKPDSTKIYRGTVTTDIYRITTPIGKRASAYADYNYYTLLINNLPAWFGWPKREVICITSIERAEDYARNNSIFVVFPVDGAKVAVCPTDDIFTSFTHTLPIITGRSFNKIIDGIVWDNRGRSTDSYNTLVKILKSLDKKKMAEYIKTIENSFFKDSVVQFYNVWQEPHKTLYDFLNDYYLNPEKCGFKLATRPIKYPRNREVWTDSRCALVHMEHYKEVMEYIGTLK